MRMFEIREGNTKSQIGGYGVGEDVGAVGASVGTVGEEVGAVGVPVVGDFVVGACVGVPVGVFVGAKVGAGVGGKEANLL